MNSLSTGRVAETLRRLFQEAEAADRPLMESFMSDPDRERLLGELIEAEHKDLRGQYHAYANNFLNVTPEFGHFLYQCARARKATLIVEFGTSMGISTIHLAAALRDMGGGRLIGTELEPSKVARARANLEAAGLADLVELREGDARQTLQDVDGDIDLLLLDGAFTLYLPVLKQLEPRLKTGAIILAENAFEQAGGYLPYVRDPANGYLSLTLPINEGRGNEFTVVTR
ncbi:O-methyltransferase [Steroidobacter flavus]|uniref:O-methyltransferase n=1 Tax=Steroidobacter flavus TaxID=1842136 RepID=A0ABV8SY92_9GAMM